MTKFLLTFYFLDFHQLKVLFFISFCDIIVIIYFSISHKIIFGKLKEPFFHSYMPT